ncbi:MAG: ABC transporter permease, partial [Pseudomonadota bacterium]
MEAFVISMMIAATPVLLAGLGELVAERSGVLNLGVEGMMLMGAVGAFAVAYSTGSTPLAILAGAGAGALMALIFCVLALSLMANQAATGLALTIFGIGASGLIGQGFVGQPLEPLAKLAIPG